MAAQLSLFSQNDDFKDYDLLWRKRKKKRIHYKTASYHKQYKNDITDEGFLKDDIALWGRMNEVYKQLANYFPPDTLKDGTRIIERDFIRLWIEEYERELYTYKGKTFKGQHFRVVMAEIIGSEDMRIDKRLKLHEEVLEMLRNNKDLECIKSYIKERLKNEEN